jgi:hypothetical protein
MCGSVAAGTAQMIDAGVVPGGFRAEQPLFCPEAGSHM